MIAPLVSVIIPTYNRRELLAEAVESSLAQRYPNVEVIIVDDGSTDETQRMVVAKLQSEWAGKVAYHHKANGGTSSAKNLGVQFVKGEYVQFLDSDDILMPDKIERQMETIHAAGAVVDCCVCYGRLGYLAAGWDKAYRIGELCPDVASMILRLCSKNVHIMHTESPLWRREFVLENPGWREDLTVSEEWEYYIRLFTANPRVALVIEELFWVRSHEGEQLSKNFGEYKKLISTYRAIQAVAKSLQPTKFWTQAVRQGLLARARTVYLNLLRHADDNLIREFEDWFLSLASSASNQFLPLVVQVRRTIGARVVCSIFDLLPR